MANACIARMTVEWLGRPAQQNKSSVHLIASVTSVVDDDANVIKSLQGASDLIPVPPCAHLNRYTNFEVLGAVQCWALDVRVHVSERQQSRCGLFRNEVGRRAAVLMCPHGMYASPMHTD